MSHDVFREVPEKGQIPGANSPEMLLTKLQLMRLEIPSDLWCELKDEGLLRADSPIP